MVRSPREHKFFTIYICTMLTLMVIGAIGAALGWWK